MELRSNEVNLSHVLHAVLSGFLIQKTTTSCWLWEVDVYDLGWLMLQQKNLHVNRIRVTRTLHEYKTFFHRKHLIQSAFIWYRQCSCMSHKFCVSKGKEDERRRKSRVTCMWVLTGSVILVGVRGVAGHCSTSQVTGIVWPQLQHASQIPSYLPFCVNFMNTFP